MHYKNKANRVFSILLHVLVWALLFIMPFILERGDRPFPPQMEMAPRLNEERMRMGIYVFQVMLIVYFYLIVYWLVPKFLNKQDGWLFTILVATTGIFILLITFGIRSTILEQPGVPVFMRVEITLSIIVLLSGVTFGLIKRSFANEKKMKDIEAENLRTELAFLRSQISPHFLLNTLNNLVSLARKRSEHLEPLLLQLSGILKYMIYESDDNKIELQEEMAYLKNYISLQQIRTDGRTNILFQSSIENDGLMIVPMLLIPFVENAFKHGITMVPDPYIDIQATEKGGELLFSVVNRFDVNEQQVKDKTSGIGHGNVKRRMELLYPGKHQLLIDKNNGLYTVQVKIDLR